jgi:predicted NBD/HSP70 family sugar kinase
MPEPVLVFDIGGSKILAALVQGPEVLAQASAATNPTAGPEAWLDAGLRLAGPWAGRYASAAAAVTGLVAEGRWSALNSAVLPIPDGFPLEARLSERLGCPVRALNDGQAAAWGEFRWGAGQGADMVFLTLSTGIGGGIVLGGRLLTGRGGLAGHIGVTAPVLDAEPPHVEDGISGRFIAAEARRGGHPVEAREVFAAARDGEAWAEEILALSTIRFARLLANVQLILAPERIVIGGSIGLAPGMIERLRAALDPLPPLRRPVLVPAALGAQAGVVGAADLAQTTKQEDHQQRSSA